ncbi:hypothetical protein CQJ94_02915 [Glycomyces fuscus]|nr:hypothetical protein CQJ94_02915 [Glycomyces fuscus]
MTLPGADELFFRPSGTDEVPEETERQHKAPEQGRKGEASSRSNGRSRGASAAKAGRAPKPSGRQRHDEKITVYISGPELLALEQTRLSLRAEHGLSADRGRLVREAVAVLLADFEENGPASMLVRRLSED